MRFIRLQNVALALGLFAAPAAFLVTLPPASYAQTQISGALAGTVTDPTGAAIPGAQITAKNATDGSTSTTVSGDTGGYRFGFLKPGAYKITATAAGFQPTAVTVNISAATAAAADIKLSVGSNQQVVEVQASDVALLHTDDPQLTTTFDTEEIQNLPNPGNDLTFIAQTAPGSVMNTQSGYGNFSSFGLPATSNTFTVNGGYENDPFLNLSNSGASNLLLGNNDVASVTVVSPAYEAAFGGLAGAQVNEISKSGSNAFHGNLSYFWNGSVMNGNDWFNDHSGTAKPRSNANQWAAAIGGPVKRDKLFFFVNTEGLRVIIPVRNTLYVPSPAWQSIITSPTAYNDLASDACKARYVQKPPSSTDNGCYAPFGNLVANGQGSQIPLYNKMFNYFNHANGAGGAQVVADDPRFVSFNSLGSNFASEWILTARADYNLGSNDKIYVHYKQDKGIQPTYTSTIDPIFNAQSPQPAYEGQMGWSHTFSPTIINQFLLTGSYSRAIFTNTNEAAATAAMPFVFMPKSGAWAGNATAGAYVGGEDYAFPQGRTVTGYQVQDDLSITRGRHTLKLGYAIRRNDVTDYTPSEHVVGEAQSLNNGDFAAGYVNRWIQRFPTRLTQPIAIYTMGAYFEDSWKPTPNLTVNAGIRLEHNANPVCQTNCFSNYASDFGSLPTADTAAYNTLFASGRHRAFLGQQNVAVEPRIGFAYQPGGAGGKTTIRGGFGMFTDTFPATIASNLDTNPPAVARFTLNGGSLAKADSGNLYTFDPASSTSASATAASSNSAFQSAYAAGGSFSSISTATNGLFQAPAYVGTAAHISMPTAEEWSLAVEHALDQKTAVSLSYVGNHTYHGAVLNDGVNAYSDSIAGLPAAAPNASLGAAEVYYTGNQSNYHGLVVSVAHHERFITAQFNYAYSHALDLVSNGGFEGFGNNPEGQIDPYNLNHNYGNADYDVRHYISANYLITVPSLKGPKYLFSGWEIGGTVFHSSGLPFSAVDGGDSPDNYLGTLLADQTAVGFDHKCGGASHAGANAPQCSFASAFGATTGFGSQGRNTLYGPSYTDTDLTVLKTFTLPFHETTFKAGAQFFNVLNHPNFGQPDNDEGDGSNFGTIQSTVSTPTSILGSFLGGDASPRLIQLTGKITF